MFKFLLFLIVFFSYNTAQAQTAPAIQWQKSLGGSSTDNANDIKQTKDGGYIVAGVTNSNDSDVVGNHGLSDCWIVKFSATGTVQWKKCYGGSYPDEARSVVQTNDGGYVIAGITQSSDGDVLGGVHGSPSNPDYWVFKIDSMGNLLWQKVFGGSELDVAQSIIKTNDSGFLIAGYSASDDGDVLGHHGLGIYGVYDFWLVKLDSNGNMQWNKCYGGSSEERAYSVVQNNLGYYFVCGFTSSNNTGDVGSNHGNRDCWIIKIDSIGNLIWQKCLGGSNEDRALSMTNINSNEPIIAGYTQSTNGDVSGNHGSTDLWVVKLDSGGGINWQQCYGGSNNDIARAISLTSDGGYIVTGWTNSADGDVSGLKGFISDMWIIKLNAAGGLQWQKCCGGYYPEEGYCIIETTDKGYILCGISTLVDGDVTSNNGTQDCWIVKLNADSLLPLRFLSYDIKLKENSGLVENRWVTGNEVNVSYFNVQRSINNIDFKTIATLNANNNVVNNYDYIENLNELDQYSSIIYYRIESLDNDGKKQYSETKRLPIYHLPFTITIYPNPATDYIIVNTKNAKQINIIDCFGRIVQQLYKPTEHQTMNTKRLPKGVFQIQVITNNKETITKSFIIQ